MARKRINYTGRERILRDDVTIEVRVAQGRRPTSACAVFELGEYSFPSEARVFIEAYRPSRMQRVRSAGVPVRAGSGAVELELGLFEEPAECLFTLSVVEAGQSGKLLGVARQLRARDPNVPDGATAALLTVERSDCGQRLWRLDLDGSLPVLHVSGDTDLVPDHRDFVRDPFFLTIVLPDVFERCLRWAMPRDPESKDEDEAAWNWCRFGEQLTQRAVPAETEGSSPELEQFVASAIDAFCRRNSIRQRYRSSRGDES